MLSIIKHLLWLGCIQKWNLLKRCNPYVVSFFFFSHSSSIVCLVLSSVLQLTEEGETDIRRQRAFSIIHEAD